MIKVIQGINTLVLKKAGIFTVFMLSVFVLSGCWDRVEMNDLAIVTATAIDKSEDDQVEISIEIFIPKSMGGSSQEVGGNGEMTMLISHKGSNLADALSKLQAKIPRKIFWGSCNVFIFGETLAEKGIQHHLDFLLRHPQPRESAFVFISEGKAKKVLAQESKLERYSAEGIRGIVIMGHGMGVTLSELDIMMKTKGQGSMLPYLTVKKEKSSEGKVNEVLHFKGTALVKGDQMAGVLSETKTSGLLWLKGEIKSGLINIRPEKVEGAVSVTPVLANAHLTPKVTSGEWKMIVHVETAGNVVQNSTNLDLNHPGLLKKIEKAYSNHIKDQISKAVEESQEKRVDVLDFNKKFQQKYPNQWEEVKNHWEEVFPEVETELVVSARINGNGFINEPAGTQKR